MLKHDIRFVEDDWENPTVGAWGLGWEVWCDGMEISQFTYMQQVGGIDCAPIPGELTYGARAHNYVFARGKDSVYDIEYNDEGVLYKDIFKQNEYEFSAYSLEHADTEILLRHFDDYEKECLSLIEKNLPLPAYDYCLKASHHLNLLDARGVIGVTERASYIGRVRNLAKAACEKWVENN